MKKVLFLLLAIILIFTASLSAQSGKDALYLFNREPLLAKPYTELPLGTIKPKGWLEDELKRMAAGMTGHLDQWYPEVCGPRNAWLGGDGDTWERGPYWIDGLYPLAKLLNDKQLVQKAQKWVEWTLNNQRADGYIGPKPFGPEGPPKNPPHGAQVHKPGDWWPRMVMLKILQQHYLATGDQRVVDVMTKYFRYQLQHLPDEPLEAPRGGKGGSWWARQRGGDNLMSVLWLYNITGDKFLLDLADILYKQTLPWTQLFLDGDILAVSIESPANAYERGVLHCVNLAMGVKTPIIRYQQDKDPKQLESIEKAFQDIHKYHGQPTGLYGGDEEMHGPGLDRGSELCTAVEMMFSLEKMFEITGDVAFADHLEKIAFNALPTQCSDDHHTRQYFQQSNQVLITAGDRSFEDDGGYRNVNGLLHGYPCCTCNLHQGWPKFVQNMWMASIDRGLAALAYGPSTITAKVADGQSVTITEDTYYPFEDTITFIVNTDSPVKFPLHLRIPAWCSNSRLSVNGKDMPQTKAAQIAILKRTWNDGDKVVLKLPMTFKRSEWYHHSAGIERGPLVYALRVEEDWSEIYRPAPEGVPADAMHRGHRECRPATPWNYALLRETLDDLNSRVKLVDTGKRAANPWNLDNAPIELEVPGVRIPYWTIYNNSAGPVPLCPVEKPANAKLETIKLIPYGCTTMRISGFPWIWAAEKDFDN